MTKKVINQKGKFDEELINTIEPNLYLKTSLLIDLILLKVTIKNQNDKTEQLNELKKQINSIENCNLKKILKILFSVMAI